MEIRWVTEADQAFVMSINPHINDIRYDHLVYTKTGYVLWEDNRRVGIMTYCLLWNNLPFMNLLFVIEECRNRGFASEAIAAWEKEMKQQGCKMVLVSTQVNEQAQHLYRKLGYVDCGSLVFHDTPLDQPMEMFMRKVL